MLILSKRGDDLLVMQNVPFVLSTRFASLLLLAVRTSTVTHASNKVTMITFSHNFKMKSHSFLVKNKQTRRRFLALDNFISRLPPEKLRNIAFIPSVLKRVQT